MIHLRRLSLMLMSVPFVPHILFAMEDNVYNFITIDKGHLQSVIHHAPNKPEWRDGQNQCWHVLAWAHFREGQEMTANLEVTEQVGFKALAPPLKLLNFITERMPHSSELEPKLIRKNKLDLHEFMDLVTNAITMGSPVLAYYMDKNGMRIVTIIGYNTNSVQLLLLTTDQAGKRATEPIDVDEFIKKMNMSQVREFCSTWSHMQELLGYQQPGVHVALQELSDQIKLYNFITFIENNADGENDDIPNQMSCRFM